MLKKAAFYSILLIFTLGFLEIGLRVFHYFYHTPIFFDGSYNQFRGQPFSDNYGFKLNSMGFKDKEFGSKKDSIYRIVGIGDSFAFGVVPYQNNYLTLLEENLKKQKKNIEVLNMGISSIGPLAYWSILEREGLALKPDMVVVSFFIGNDIKENIFTRRNKMVSYSYLASLVFYLGKLKKLDDTIYMPNQIYCDTCQTTNRETYIETQKFWGSIYWKDDEMVEKGIEGAAFYFSKIKQVCDRNNIKLVVLLLPNHTQINAKIRSEVISRDEKRRKLSDWDDTQPNRLWTQKLDELNIVYLDLYDTFNNMPKDTVLYKPNDTHWNIRGNRLAADAISRYLITILPNQ